MLYVVHIERILIHSKMQKIKQHHVLPTLIQEVILLVLPIVVVDVMLLLAFMAHMIARKYGCYVASVMTLLALLGMVVPLSNYITRLVLHL